MTAGLTVLVSLFLYFPESLLAQSPEASSPALLGPGVTVETSAANSTTTAPPLPETTRSQYGTYERAMVREVREQIIKTSKGAQKRLTYTLEILSGQRKGTWLTTVTDASALPAGLDPQIGETVIIFIQPGPNQTEPVIFFESHDRLHAYLWIVFILIACGLFLAGRQGLKIILAALLAWLAVFHLAIPLYLAQHSVTLVILIFLCTLTALLSWLLLGWNKKALIAFIGSLTGGLMAYGLICLFTSWTHLEIALTSVPFFNDHPNLDPKSLLLLAGALVITGFITDLAASIAVAVTEVKQFSAGLGFKELFRAGMIVGRDRLFFMAPLLFLVYLGTAALTLTQNMAADYPWLKFTNLDSMAQVIILPLTAILALMLSVPLCSAIAALAWTRHLRVMDPLRRATSWRRNEKSPPDEQQSLPLSES